MLWQLQIVIFAGRARADDYSLSTGTYIRPMKGTRMRILYIHNINQVAQTYGEDLVRRGHSVSIFEPSLIGASAPLPLKVALMPQRLFNLRDVAGMLDENHFDLVHIHWASYGVLGLLSKIPFIVHCHGDDVLRPSFRPILKSIFRHAAAVICITPDLLAHVRPIRPDTIFLPASIDTNRFRPTEDNQINLTQPWTVLLFACLTPKKGLEISTQGIAKFAQRHPEVRVQLVDWGPEKEKYKQRYGGRFEFVPQVAPELVQRLIAQADVVVGQFRSGAIGFSELQAMSYGKSVIALFRYEEVYSTPPPLYQATTAKEVDENLENLYQHPELARETRQRAREWVIANHNHLELATRLEELYQSILTKQQERFSLTTIR